MFQKTKHFHPNVHANASKRLSFEGDRLLWPSSDSSPWPSTLTHDRLLLTWNPYIVYNFRFLVSFSFETIFPLSPTATTLVSKDVKFYCASFGPYEKFVGGCPPTQTPTQMLKSVFSILSSQETGSSSVSLTMIFGALQFELFRFKIHSLCSKILKIPEFTLNISNTIGPEFN